MSEDEQKNIITVQASESGQKLLQFLLRRLALPQPLLHRWIRTGQIRINGGRAKPFLHVQVGDCVRMPPFALNMVDANFAKARDGVGQDFNENISSKALILPDIIFENEHLYVFNKPYGLPVHTGTGHTDSLATRLNYHFNNLVFKPTPAHRLDKDTTGIILVAKSYAGLNLLQNGFENRSIAKEYLTWVCGHWPHSQAIRLSHSLASTYLGYDEKVRVSSGAKGRESICIVKCLRHENNCSLMHIRLVTGRKHQIRVQLAAEGYPVFGDGKYGAEYCQNASQIMLLHALRISLPTDEDYENLNLQGKTFEVLPTWDGWQKIKHIPEPLTVEGL